MSNCVCVPGPESLYENVRLSYLPMRDMCVGHLSVNELKGQRVGSFTAERSCVFFEDHVIDPNFLPIAAAVWKYSH